MSLLDTFLDPSCVSLKICGITTASDAQELVNLGVTALGVNFWPHSKRYLNPDDAHWLRSFAGKILRVGVFVNATPAHAIQLVESGLIDVIQLHGDETPEQAQPYRDQHHPFIKAIGVKTLASLDHAHAYGAKAVLLDAHAPSTYGGTGATFDWNHAIQFKHAHPNLPLILAGGIVPENAAQAAHTVAPAALDIASGAEISPGIKDFHKVQALIHAIQSSPS